MLRYALRRLLFGVATLLGGMTFIFLAINTIPGDPATLMLDDLYSGDAYDALVAKLGLDKPLAERYFIFLKDTFQGDLGTSFRSGRSVTSEILSLFPYTLTLAVSSLIIGIVLGVTIGIIAAMTRNRAPDQFSMVFALSSISAPSFFVGVILIFIFSVKLNWFPSLGGGSWDDPQSILSHLLLPAMALGVRSSALIARVTRSGMIEILNQDYIRTAYAKGLRRNAVLVRHALRNALMPLITVVGLDLGALLGGSAIMEIVFNRPGMGNLLVSAVLNRDYPIVQGTIIFYMVVILILNIVTDVVYGISDPRVRFD